MASVATIRLKDDTRAAISRIATRKRTTPTAFIRKAVEEAVAREESGLSVYDLAKDVIGRASSGVHDRSSDTGRKMAAALRRQTRRDSR